ncbi:MAG: serine hydrolase [Bacteroidetes bacterium]|nr:serine hydrolase [Bacteroidota bacterium]
MGLRKYLLTFCFVSDFLFSAAQSTDKDLDKALTKIYKEADFPGFALSVIKEDSVLFSKAYGFADIAKRIPYSLETIQPIGSVSKTIIALALMKSIELGYFRLETNINELLPFNISNPYFPNDIITVKHLATHTSSLVDNQSVYYNVVYQAEKKPTIELGSFLKDYYTKEGKYYSPDNFDSTKAGSNYSYSNIGSALMAYIIEVKAKMLFPDFTEKYIFQPLSMTNTSWFYDENYANNYATLYQINKPESPLEERMVNADKSLLTYSCVTYPDGSLKTSVNDLTFFLKAMMKGYFSNDCAIITKSSYKTLFEKQFTDSDMPKNMDEKEPNRAIFWGYSRKGAIRHTGSDPGVFSFISFDPVSRIGRVMTLNASLEGGDNLKSVEYFKKIIAALDRFEETVK